jgi:hypothetical protein
MPGDCNDTVNTINPETSEKCNQIDDDCDGLIDDSLIIPVISTTRDPNICFGESINLFHNLNTSNFDWNGQFIGLSVLTIDTSGTFVLRNRSTDCLSQPFTVTVHPRSPKPTIASSGSLEICLDEFVELFTAQPSSKYAWSSGETTSSIRVFNTKTVTLSVTDSGFACPSIPSDPVTVVVNQPPGQPSIQNTIFNNVCRNSKLPLTLANSMYSYSMAYWSNGDSGNTVLVGPGTYSVRIKGYNGCFSTPSTPVTIFEKTPPNKPTIRSSNGGNNIFCTNGQVELITNAGGSHYYWNGSYTPSYVQYVSQSGKYSVTSYFDGCPSEPSDSFQVIIAQPPPTPIIGASGPLIICNNNPLQLNAPQAQQYLWSTGATTSSISVNRGGLYSVTITDANGCSASSSPIAIDGATNGYRESIIVPGGPTSFCLGDSVSLSASSALPTMTTGYLWSNGATTNPIQVNSSGDYTVTIYYSNGCQSQVSPKVTVTASSTPTPPTIYAYGNATDCAIYTQPVQLNSSASNGNLWNQGQTTQQISVTQSGTYTVTANDPAHCVSGTSAPFSFVRSDPSSPVITASGPLTFCEGDSVILTSSHAGFNFWSNGMTSQSITIKTSGAFSVYYKDSLGCFSNQSSSIVVSVLSLPEPPRINCLGAPVSCLGSNISLSAGGAINPEWSTGQTNSIISVNTQGYYKVRQTSLFGCTSRWSDSLLIEFINPPPKPVIQVYGPTDFCIGNTTVIQSSPAFSYLWNDNYYNRTRSINSPGTYSVQVMDATGCISLPSDQILINVRPKPVKPTLSFEGVRTICAGGSGFSLSCSPSFAYAWNTGASTNTIQIQTGGTYTVQAIDSFGCISDPSNSLYVFANVFPQAPYISNFTTLLCAGDSAKFSSSHPLNNLWSTGDTTQVIWVKSPGIYSVTVNDSANCISGTASSPPVNVLPLPPTPILTANGPTEICEGGPGVGVFTTPLNNGEYLMWSDNFPYNTSFRSIMNSTTLSVRLVITNGIQCISNPSNAITITAYPNPAPPQISIALGNQVFCAGDSVRLVSSQSIGNLWNTGDTTNQITLYSTGTYSVNYTDSNGCTSTNADFTIVQEPPLQRPEIISGGIDSVLCEGESTILFLWYPFGTSSIIWNDGATSDFRSVINEGYYYARVISTAGCLSDPSDSIYIKVNPLPQKPSITLTGNLQGAGSTLFLCDLDTLILGSSYTASQYKWNDGNYRQFDTTSTFKVINPPLSIYGGRTYILSTKDSNGCISPESDPITINGATRPVAAIGTGPNNPPNFCEGTGGITVTANILNQTYLWNNGQTTFSFPVDSSGTYVLTITSAQGCSSLPSAPFTVTRLPNMMLYRDQDFDQLGDPNHTLYLCYNPGGWALNYLDCNDYDYNPNAATAVPYYRDLDSDGYGDPLQDTAFCFAVSGFVTNSTDCNDSNLAINPSAHEKCNLIDDDCDAIADDSLNIPQVTLGGSPEICPGGSVTLSSNLTTDVIWNNGVAGPTLLVTEGGNYYIRDTVTQCESDPILVIGCFKLKPLEAVASAGNNATGPNAIISFTIGQPFYNQFMSSTGEVREGVQQSIVSPAESVTLDILVYIEGFYQGGTTQPLVEILGPGLCDSITVSLYAADPPNALLHSAPVILSTSGTGSLALPAELAGRLCYISLRHRNTVETWSKDPILLGPSNSFDFTH